MGVFRGIRRAFRDPVRAPGVDEDVDAELRFHLETRADELVAEGMDPAAARARALREFGDVGAFARECRQISEEHRRAARRAERMDSVWQDLRYAARGLARAPGFAAAAVLTVALGIGAPAAVFAVVSSLLLRPLPYEGADRIVVLTEAEIGSREIGSRESGTSTSYLNALDWKAQSRTLETVGIVDDWSPALTGAGEPERLQGAMITAEVFDVLRVRPALGRPILPEDNQEGRERVVVLGDGFWRRRFAADPEVVGRRITLSGTPYTVVGVLPAGFRGPAELGGEVWGNNYMDRSDTRGSRYLRAFGRLRPGVAPEEARTELRTLAARLARAYPEDNRNMTAVVTPLREELAGDVRTPLGLLLGAAGLVLLIACANLSNLLLERGTARHREFAVRTALGASRARVVRQLLTESLFLALLGGAAGLLLAAAAVRLAVVLGPATLREQGVSVDGRVLAFTAVLVLVTATLFGLVPALRTTRVDVQATLKQGARGSTAGEGGRLRAALSVAQLGLALTLLVGAGLLLRSFARVQATDPGIRSEGVLTLSFNLPASRYPSGREPAALEEVVRRVEALPGARSAAVTSILPFGGSWDRIGIEVEGEPRAPGASGLEADRYIVSPEYFRTLGIRLRSGRLLTARDRDDAPPVAVVDEVFARKIAPDGRAVGKRFRLPGRDEPATVVGVVGHVRHYGLDAVSGGQVYMSHLQYPWRWVSLVVRTEGDPLRLAPAAREAVWAVDRDLAVFDVGTMGALMAERTSVRRFTLLLLGAFAAVALVTATIGLYGVIAYGVAQRRLEIGIRLALGARPGDVVRMVVRRGAALALVGTGLGVVAALAGGRLLRSLLYGVANRDPVVLAGASLLLLAVALAASYLPARRAAAVDPMSSMRAE